MNELSGLDTEATAADAADLDLLPVAELAARMNAGDQHVPLAVRDALPAIVPAIEAVVERLAAGGRLCYVGAGTPGRLAVVDASECPPTFNTDPDLVTAVIAGGPAALTNSIEGAEDDWDAGRAVVDERGLTAGDVVVGVAASGRTPFVLGAIEAANEIGALTLGVASVTDSRLGHAAAYPIEVVVGPEFITGSTRLKAGTAQKLVLNMISTITMIRLGKTYGPLMVDVRASNAKLRIRAIRIVVEITGATEAEAREALERSGWEVKVATLVLLRGLEPAAARELLGRHDGRLRPALDGEE
ncbi:N-acetylmuramic acid 6-phosphate etherase [Enemella evansiae]|uniref:N-acetylmuramic acid 6-phosphate etherase n=1 Tax=Enemella evansiae TaxID=2016499 RepID=UPI000B970E93|nr:N-acetylmuramic acid 6-phosphate etherase [Enemella evansiae]OYO13820.1 N-acetylmuramic acid 6-phosphate etherase [Enemella evansiae]